MQDDEDNQVWNVWGVTNRDLVILDGDSVVSAVMNLTSHTLEDPGNLAMLTELLEAAAE